MELDGVSGELTDVKFELFLSGHDRFELNLVVLFAPVADL
jgi:hypothetical protein